MNEKDTHFMDQLAQRLYEALEARVVVTEKTFAGPVPVGTKKAAPVPVTDTTMPDLDRINRMLGIQAGLGPHMDMAAQALGSHAAVLAPYFLQGEAHDGEQPIPE